MRYSLSTTYRTGTRDKTLRKSAWEASETCAGMLSVRLYTLITSREAVRELKEACVKDS